MNHTINFTNCDNSENSTELGDGFKIEVTVEAINNDLIAEDFTYNNERETLPLPQFFTLSKASEQTSENLKEFNDILNSYYKENEISIQNPALEIPLVNFNHSNFIQDIAHDDFNDLENIQEDNEFVDITDCKILSNLMFDEVDTINEPLNNLTHTVDTSNLRAYRKPITNNTDSKTTKHSINDMLHTNNQSNCTKSATKIYTENQSKQFDIDCVLISSDDVRNIDLTDVILISDDEDGNDVKSLRSDKSNDCDGYHSSDFEFIDENEAKRAGFIDRKFEIVKEINPEIDYYFVPDNDSHVVREGDDFINLFNGNYTPMPIHCVENKAVSTGPAMDAQFGAIGFDYHMFDDTTENRELKIAALEAEKKILSLYPAENRRRRRRRY